MKVLSILKRPTNSIPLSYEKFISNSLDFKCKESIQQKLPIKSIFGDLNTKLFESKKEANQNPFGKLSNKHPNEITFNLNSLKHGTDFSPNSAVEAQSNSVSSNKSVNNLIHSNKNELSPFNHVSKIKNGSDNAKSTVASDSNSINNEINYAENGNNESGLSETTIYNAEEQFKANSTDDSSEKIVDLVPSRGHIGSDVFEGRYAHLKPYRHETFDSIVQKGVDVLDRLNCLIKERSIRGLSKECLDTLSEMKKHSIQASTETYNNCILSCMKSKNDKLARYLFLCMRSELLTPDLRTYTLMIKTHINCGDISSAFSIYRKMEKEGVKADLVVFSALIDSLVESKLTSNAWRLFNYMRTWRLIEPDEVLFTIMIKSCSISRDAEKALNLYQEMLTMNLFPTIHTYTELIKCLSRRKEYFHECFQFYAKIKSQEYPINTTILTHLLQSCCTVGNVRRARELLSEARTMGIKPTMEMHTIYIKTFGRHMKLNKLSENEKINHIRKTWEIAKTILSGYLSDPTSNSGASGAVADPNGDDTTTPYNREVTRLLNSVITVYESGNYYDYALEVLNCFPRFNAKPDYMTYYILLRMVGPGMKDVGRFFALWTEAKSHIAPQKPLLHMALDMAILSRSAKKTLEILNDMYNAKVFPTASLMKRLYESGKHITQIHVMINNLVTLQRKITYQERLNENRMLQTYIDENELNKSATPFKSL